MSKSVIIIGCGIAGPVLAMLLKHSGFDPVIYERRGETEQAGLALGVSPQTLLYNSRASRFKVLNILGLAEQLLSLGQPIDEMVTHSQLRAGAVLGRMDLAARLRATLGWPSIMVSRARYCQFLADAARERGIPLHLGKRLIGLRDEGERVTALFEDGSEAEGDILVGCDGLHSAVRNTLFGKEEAHYMGLVQIGGFSPTPLSLLSRTEPSKSTAHQYFGNGAHFIGAPVSQAQMVWVATLPQPEEAREDWRRLTLSDPGATELLAGLEVATWDGGPKELVRGATFVTKYGLYDRPISERWHLGRVVLVGDAAHPTSPHLGQGANQAMEDCYHLVRLLCKAEPWTSSTISTAFQAYEALRSPIVALSVAGAKREGEKRVLSGVEACQRRDAMIESGGGVDPERMRLQGELMKGPFQGRSEI
ncbi:FAD/NAD(P)-binding domain-containing protein [Calocera cornea HHB12733]|uniref:FAD/NAD(P)-binding domain-containing protein n=1 Tax=Calocera cornea HHB12733 TaxID=1353952 RepID=A0A165EFR7_9BASI|nr:FAD/NAD(P)-binding domain-containing protein [Calocera cornea HHB12733]